MPDKTVNVSMYVVKRNFARDFADIIISKTIGEIHKVNGEKYFLTSVCPGHSIPLTLKKMTSASDVVACETLEEANDVAFDAIDDAIERVSAVKVVVG